MAPSCSPICSLYLNFVLESYFRSSWGGGSRVKCLNKMLRIPSLNFSLFICKMGTTMGTSLTGLHWRTDGTKFGRHICMWEEETEVNVSKTWHFSKQVHAALTACLHQEQLMATISLLWKANFCWKPCREEEEAVCHYLISFCAAGRSLWHLKN